MPRVKHMRVIALAVALVFLFSSVAFAAVPQYVYFKSGSDMVKVDYAKAVNDAMNDDNTLYNAVKQYVGEAEETGAPVIVETDDQKVLDYQKALGAGKRFADIVNDPAYQTSRPDVQKELRVENGQAVIGDVQPAVVEIVSVSAVKANGSVDLEVVLSAVPEETPTAPSVDIKRYINGELDETFVWRGGTSSWDEATKTLRIIGVALPEATNVDQEVVYSVAYGDSGNYVDSNTVTVEAEAADREAAAAAAVDALIAALPPVEELTLDDKAAVEAAREAYDALTEAQKALVENLAVLEAAEARIAELEAQQALVRAAEQAVVAYEEFVVANYNDIATAEDLRTAAQEAVERVRDINEEIAGAFEVRIAAKAAAIDEALAGVVARVNAARNQVELLRALEGFFLAVNADNIGRYAELVRDARPATVDEIQFGVVYTANIEVAVSLARTQVQLLNALLEGEALGLLQNVDPDLIGTYFNEIAQRLDDGVELVNLADIQAVIDGAVGDLVAAAEAAVAAAEGNPAGDELINTAQAAIDALPAYAAERDELQARLDAVRVVNAVLTATNDIRLLAALQVDAFVRVNPDWVAEYRGLNATTIAGLQDRIDEVNAEQVDVVIADLEGAPTRAGYVEALALVNNFVAPGEQQQQFLDRLAVVDAVLNVQEARNADDLLAALQSDLLGLDFVYGQNSAFYWAVHQDEDAPEMNSAEDIQVNIVDAGNARAIAEVIDAINGVDESSTGAQLLALLERLAAITPTNDEDGFDLGIVVEDWLADYVTAFVGGDDVDSVGGVTGIISNVNNNRGTISVEHSTITADREPAEYTSGESITLTLTLCNDSDNVVLTENGTYAATITIGTDTYNTDTYNRNITFNRGVAVITVPARTAGEGLNVAITVPGLDAGLTFTSEGYITINVGAPAALVIEPETESFTITVTDRINTVDTVNGNYIVNVTVVDANGNPRAVNNADAEGNVNVAFTQGVSAPIVVDGLSSGDVITVEIESLGLTAQLTV
ncbi:hypothetical protein Desku_0265 [Desulfofundulus kuznetsovii DSM 6115]|uniref:Big-1 domain-containing protein n=2 Tax=Desulfofundulus kuznetsovii TaxID=58135 RepID=A0AAU8PN02_DESK7|nr:hypothetical protein Desku_0265 [Desulfofundulus kuznetsovii DSM 6115]